MEKKAKDVEALRDSWWKGLRLWYNEANYVEAMEVWFQAIDRFYANSMPSEIDESAFASIRAATQRSDDTPLARLLLFLAGCSLDSGQTSRARRFLLCSLVLAATDSCTHKLLIDNILVEYMATFQEEANDGQTEETRSHVQAYNFLRLVIESDCVPLMRRTNPYYRAPYLVPHYTPGQPVCSEHPAWCKALEENFEVIQQELESLLPSARSWPRVGDAAHRDGAGAHDGSVVSTGSWNEIVLFGSTGGTPHLAPRTSRLIEKYCSDHVLTLVDAGAGDVILSLLQPRTRIEPHTAIHNLRLTAHLGLVVPESAEDCYLNVAGEHHGWRAGKMLVFDDAFEHGVVNDTDEIRVVLLLRFWHPSLPHAQRQQALDHVLHAKKTDQLRRFNPPIPDGSHVPRGMEQDYCHKCGATGYDSLRVVNRQFFCLCGALVESP